MKVILLLFHYYYFYYYILLLNVDFIKTMITIHDPLNTKKNYYLQYGRLASCPQFPNKQWAGKKVFSRAGPKFQSVLV